MQDFTCQKCNKVFRKHRSRKAQFCSRSCFNKREITEEYRSALSFARKGILPKNFIDMQKLGWASVKGSKHTEEHKKNIADATRLALKKKIYTQAERDRSRKVIKQQPWFGRKGAEHPLYKHGMCIGKKSKEYVSHHNKIQKRKRQGVEGYYSQEEWEALKIRWGFMCLCCKKSEPEILLTADHIVPVSRGGKGDISNIQPLCQSCNSRKSVKTIDYSLNVSLV